MDRMSEAWEQFLRTGKVGDYLNYCHTLGSQPTDQDLIESGDYPDADEYAGGGNWRPGY